MKKAALMPVFVALVIISACSKTPKQEALTGFYDGCYIAKDENLKKFCECVVGALDNSLDDKFFDNVTPERTAAIFVNKIKELSVECKNKDAIFPSRSQETDSPAQPSNKDQLSVAPRKENPDVYFKKIEEDALAEYNKKWREISSDPESYINRCTEQDAQPMIDLGGSKREDAINSARKNCISQLAELKMCMEKQNPNATACFQDTFERSD